MHSLTAQLHTSQCWSRVEAKRRTVEKARVEATDWVPTQNKHLHYSTFENMYRIAHTSEVQLVPETHLDTCLAAHMVEENTDHGDTDNMLSLFPEINHLI